MNPNMITTAFELPGYKIVRNVGLMRGIVVRSRSVIGNAFAGLQAIFGGNITVYTNLCERARADAYSLMCLHAEKNGANAIISMRYDTTEIAKGISEVLCYGTGVVVEEIKQ